MLSRFLCQHSTKFFQQQRAISGSASSGQEWREIPVMIHGIDPSDTPKPHDDSYHKLLNNMKKALKDKSQQLEAPIKVEWGWPSGQVDSTGAPFADEILADVQRDVWNRVDPVVDAAPFDITINPVWRKMANVGRKMFILGIGDMFYYTSPNGKKAVRKHVFNYIKAQLLERYAHDPKPVSLTVIGHSAGSVICHDLLYHLYRPDEQKCHPELLDARRLIAEKKLRIRRLFTIGSPITPLILRSEPLMLRLKGPKPTPLSPADLGFLPDEQLSGPRWVNFWDKDDVISCPVACFYEDNKIVIDQYVDVGSGPSSHIEYWSSTETASLMAKYW